MVISRLWIVDIGGGWGLLIKLYNLLMNMKVMNWVCYERKFLMEFIIVVKKSFLYLGI